MIDWIKVRNYYIHHSISLEKLAKKFNISYSATQKRSAKENWADLKSEKAIEIEQEVQARTKEKVVAEKIAVNKRHIDLAEQSLDIVQDLLKLYKQELAEGKKKTKASAYTMDYILSAISKAQKVQRLALNITEEESGNDEPEITIIEGIDTKKI